jgi:hypothetical protein
MDAIFLIIGVVLVIFGAKKKDADGTRSGGGLVMIIAGAVFLVLGLIIFIISFAAGASGALG